MQISFDPNDPDDVRQVRELLDMADAPAPLAGFTVNATAVDTPNGPVVTGLGPITNAGGVEVDSRGVPFIAAVHATGADGKGAKNKDGSWRKGRNIDKAQVEAAEMAARSANPIAMPNAAATAPLVAQPYNPPSDLAAMYPGAVGLTPPAAPMVPGMPQMPGIPQMAPAQPTATYPDVLAELARVQSVHGPLDPALWGQWVVASGIGDVNTLPSDGVACAKIVASIRAMYPAAA